MALQRDRVKVVKRRLADGTIKEYRYTGYGKRCDQPSAPNSLGALLAAYRSSPEFTRRSNTTIVLANLYLRPIEQLAAYPVSELNKAMILRIRDGFAAKGAPAAANKFVQVVKKMLNWAVDRGWIEFNPVFRMSRIQEGTLPTWTAEEADYAQEHLPEPLSRVVILGRYTGQRRGDLIKMLWSDYDGRTIRVQQQKNNGKENAPPLMIPVHPVLKQHLERWKVAATEKTILVGARGKPFLANSLTTQMGNALAKIDMRDELNNHGLRKLAATELANAGCTAHQIAAITGHSTLAMVQLYTKAADQRRLASEAMEKMAAHFPQSFPHDGKREKKADGKQRVK